MRTKRTLINASIAITSQLVSLMCGLILPRLILSHYGSEYNGITTSITQFMTCVILMRAGIGGVSRAALYKPLSENNSDEVSGVINATQEFMKRISLLILAGILLFSFFYPLLVINEFDYLFSFTLVLILGISVFMDNYFGVTYQILLEADQRKYIYSILTIITTIINTIVACYLILMDFDIRIVKLGSAIVFSLKPIILSIYVKRNYTINKSIQPNKKALAQRWDSFTQQIAVFVTNNTDVMVLTIFSDLRVVSVYSVYNMVFSALYQFNVNLIDSCEAPIGDILAKGGNKIYETMKKIELITFSVSVIIYGCTAQMIIPFTKIYTNGINDVNYIVPVYAFLCCIHQFFSCIRLPYFSLVTAAGHFKQMKNGSIIEAIINISISVILVIKIGLIGVAVGTICAILFRTIQYSMYTYKNILKVSYGYFLKRLVVSLCEVIITYYLTSCLTINSVNYWGLAIHSSLICVVELLVVFSVEFLFYPHTLKSIFNSFFQRK